MEQTKTRWSNVRARLMLPSNLDEAREEFLSPTTNQVTPIDTIPGNDTFTSTPLPLRSPMFQYSPTVTAESRAERLATPLRTPCTDLLPQAIKVLTRAVEQYGRGNVLLASDPPALSEPAPVSNSDSNSDTVPSSVVSPSLSMSASSSTTSSTPSTLSTPSMPSRKKKKVPTTKLGPTGSTIPLHTHLSRKKALKYLKTYLSANRLDSHCTVKFCDNLPSAGIFINRPKATLARINCDDAYFGGDEDCKHSLLVSSKLLSSKETKVSAIRIVSFAVHEIGTHLVRRSNEEIQPWLRKHNKYNMVKDERLIKATEEGLAMVHEAMHLPSLLLARPALYYFASAKALTLSFVDLFDALEEWVSDPTQRFDICALVKRGKENTHQPGGNGEVQVYFEGAVKILEQVDTIDPVLLFCGRITLDDMKLSRVQRVVRRDGVLLPEFARNIYKYRKQLRKISLANGIEDLKIGKARTKKKMSSKVETNGPETIATECVDQQNKSKQMLVVDPSNNTQCKTKNSSSDCPSIRSTKPKRKAKKKEKEKEENNKQQKQTKTRVKLPNIVSFP